MSRPRFAITNPAGAWFSGFGPDHAPIWATADKALTYDCPLAARLQVWQLAGTDTPIMRGGHLDMDQCAARYPRIMRAMQWCAILSRSEASSALRDWRAGHRTGGSEAVAHFGGPGRVLVEAIRARGAVRKACGGRLHHG